MKKGEELLQEAVPRLNVAEEDQVRLWRQKGGAGSEAVGERH